MQNSYYIKLRDYIKYYCDGDSPTKRELEIYVEEFFFDRQEVAQAIRLYAERGCVASEISYYFDEAMEGIGKNVANESWDVVINKLEE